MQKFTLTKASKGSSLIEVLIATMVVSVVMIALASAMTISVRNTAQSKYRAQAATRAQEILEVFRRVKVTSGWSSFSQDASGGVYCFNSLPATHDDLADFLAVNAGACQAGVEIAGTDFIHDVSILQNVQGTVVTDISVQVTVEWIDGERQHEVIIDQVFRDTD